MTLEEKLTAILRTIVPDSFCDFAPVGQQVPYCTYQQIGGVAPTFIDNAVPSKENAVMQVNVWDSSRRGAKDKIKQIEAALIAATDLQARPFAAAASTFDADMARYASSQDFSIWADR
jgi:hypothetical protein